MILPTEIQAYLDDPAVTDLCLNGPDEIFFDRGQGMEPVATGAWEESAYKLWILELLSSAGKSWDARHPFLDATLRSGHRMHVVFPPVAHEKIHVSFRRLGSVHPARRWPISPIYTSLAEIVQKGESLLISGPTGSGKTTLANELLSEIDPKSRIIALEDTSELRPDHPHFLSLTSRPPNADGYGEISLRALLKQSLRMRPDRIVLGECRGDEVLELLQALNTGHRGSLATIHANSARDAIRRVELLCLLGARGTIPVMVIRELLAQGLQWIAQVERSGPLRQVTELIRIEGREGETLLTRPFLKRVAPAFPEGNSWPSGS